MGRGLQRPATATGQAVDVPALVSIFFLFLFFFYFFLFS